MDPITLVSIALTLIATKASEKKGENLGEDIIAATKSLLGILRQKTPATVRRLESEADAPHVIDAEIIEEVQRVAEADPEVQEALKATVQAMQQQFGDVTNQGKLAEKIGLVFQGGYNPVNIEKLELLLESSGGALTKLSTPKINWYESCKSLHSRQKQIWLSTNPLGTDFAPEQVYVPINLLEREDKARRHEPNSSIQGMELYQAEMEFEAKCKFTDKEFFHKVLRNSDTDKSKGKRIAVIGEAGSGKTLFLWNIADWLLKSEQNKLDLIPILVKLADLEPNQRLEEYLVNVWLKKCIANPNSATQESFKELLIEGKAVLILDGADEITLQRQTPLSFLANQLTEGIFLNSRVIISCRTNLWDEDYNALVGFDIFRCLPFEEEQIEKYICNWFSKQNKDFLGTSLITEIEQTGKEYIKDLVRNPLRLTLTCLVYKKGGKLPKNRTGLYARLVKSFYIYKQETIKVTELDVLHNKLADMAKASLDSSQGSRYRLRESFIEPFLGDRNDPRSLFNLACSVNWLVDIGLPRLEESDPDERIYSFFHTTFQEYLASISIADWIYFCPSDVGEISYSEFLNRKFRIFQPEWKECILFWLSRTDISSETKESIDDFTRYILSDNISTLYFKIYLLSLFLVSDYEFSFISLDVDSILCALLSYYLGLSSDKNEYSKDLIEGTFLSMNLNYKLTLYKLLLEFFIGLEQNIYKHVIDLCSDSINHSSTLDTRILMNCIASEEITFSDISLIGVELMTKEVSRSELRTIYKEIEYIPFTNETRILWKLAHFRVPPQFYKVLRLIRYIRIFDYSYVDIIKAAFRLGDPRILIELERLVRPLDSECLEVLRKSSELNQYLQTKISVEKSAKVAKLQFTDHRRRFGISLINMIQNSNGNYKSTLIKTNPSTKKELFDKVRSFCVKNLCSITFKDNIDLDSIPQKKPYHAEALSELAIDRMNRSLKCLLNSEPFLDSLYTILRPNEELKNIRLFPNWNSNYFIKLKLSKEHIPHIILGIKDFFHFICISENFPDIFYEQYLAYFFCETLEESQQMLYSLYRQESDMLNKLNGAEVLDLLWYCSEKLTYPEFVQLWN
jgi:hypothetical protein